MVKLSCNQQRRDEVPRSLLLELRRSGLVRLSQLSHCTLRVGMLMSCRLPILNKEKERQYTTAARQKLPFCVSFLFHRRRPPVCGVTERHRAEDKELDCSTLEYESSRIICFHWEECLIYFFPPYFRTPVCARVLGPQLPSPASMA